MTQKQYDIETIERCIRVLLLYQVKKGKGSLSLSQKKLDLIVIERLEGELNIMKNG